VSRGSLSTVVTQLRHCLGSWQCLRTAQFVIITCGYLLTCQQIWRHPMATKHGDSRLVAAVTVELLVAESHVTLYEITERACLHCHQQDYAPLHKTSSAINI
jgi:hypothetical protein